ncbi:MAG: class I SAM-dependent methyltransferase [Bacteroidetes bacterium]|nr:class I SAM-dependent methyltransferase [Bacteroidota bacterium]
MAGSTNTVPADFIFIDGNHTYEATMRYFNWILPKVRAKTMIIFDDINWSAGMQQAWLEIQQHPKVTQSLDFYLWELLFRSEPQQTTF